MKKNKLRQMTATNETQCVNTYLFNIFELGYCLFMLKKRNSILLILSIVKFANTIFAMKKGGGQRLCLEKVCFCDNTKPVKTNLMFISYNKMI